MSKASVIVPVYNAEQYLDKCIRSILNSSFTDIELILVDDGSNDNSGGVCDRYALVDKRVKTYHKPNGGVSSARNIGLDYATGEWIAFVDSDDWVKPDYLRDLFSHTDDNIDLVVSFPEVHLKDSIFKIDRYVECRLTGNEVWKAFTKYDFQEHTSPWGKLFRASVVRKHAIRFDESMCFGEDTVFLYTFLLYARGICVSTGIGYCYRGETDSSLSKRINPVDTEYLNYAKVREAVNVLIKRKNIENDEALYKLKFMEAAYVWRVLNSLYHGNSSREKRLGVLFTLDMSVLECKKSLSVKDTVLIFMLRHRLFRLYDLARRIKSKNKGE